MGAEDSAALCLGSGLTDICHCMDSCLNKILFPHQTNRGDAGQQQIPKKYILFQIIYGLQISSGFVSLSDSIFNHLQREELQPLNSYTLDEEASSPACFEIVAF